LFSCVLICVCVIVESESRFIVNDVFYYSSYTPASSTFVVASVGSGQANRSTASRSVSLCWPSLEGATPDTRDTSCRRCCTPRRENGRRLPQDARPRGRHHWMEGMDAAGRPGRRRELPPGRPLCHPHGSPSEDAPTTMGCQMMPDLAIHRTTLRPCPKSMVAAGDGTGTATACALDLDGDHRCSSEGESDTVAAEIIRWFRGERAGRGGEAGGGLRQRRLRRASERDERFFLCCGERGSPGLL
jgi:hypothetical protein